MRSSIWRFELPSQEHTVIHEGAMERCLDDLPTRLGIIWFNQINVDKFFTVSHATIYSVKFFKSLSLYVSTNAVKKRQTAQRKKRREGNPRMRIEGTCILTT
jgi:hypothetical protein